MAPEGVCIGPGQLEGLSHDEAAEYLVKSIPVLWLADNQILQFGILTEIFMTYESCLIKSQDLSSLPPSTQSFLV